MNERIKQLADEAQYYAEYTTPQGLEWLPAFKEKFAELIVKECANFVENIFDDDGGHAPCEDYAKGIKKHFGVQG